MVRLDSFLADGIVLLDLLGIQATTPSKIQIDSPLLLTEVLSLLKSLAISGILISLFSLTYRN